MNTRLYIPPRTKLETIWRRVTPTGEVQWEVYTTCADRNAPYEQMLGTAIILCDDGLAMRHTEHGPGTVPQMFDIMPAVKGL